MITSFFWFYFYLWHIFRKHTHRLCLGYGIDIFPTNIYKIYGFLHTWKRNWIETQTIEFATKKGTLIFFFVYFSLNCTYYWYYYSWYRLEIFYLYTHMCVGCEMKIQLRFSNPTRTISRRYDTMILQVVYFFCKASHLIIKCGKMARGANKEGKVFGHIFNNNIPYILKFP